MALLAVLLALTLGISFVCSVLEAVLLSITPSYVAASVNNHPRLGRVMERLKTDAERPLAAILALNTIANTAGATGVGAQATIVFGNSAVGITSAILTLLVLFVSEIVPKTLGATYWRALEPVTTRIVNALIVLMFPFVVAGSILRRLISRREPPEGMSSDEIHAIAELGHKEGLLDADESRVLQNIVRFGSVLIRDVMTPRTVVVAFPDATTVAEAIDQRAGRPFPSRVPVFEETIDSMTGYVMRVDVLQHAVEGRPGTPLSDLKREVPLVPDSLSLRQAINRLIDEREHIVVVIDEYGGTAGIVTIEDVLETLLGREIVDESDSAHDMQLLARRRWKRRARELGIIDTDTGITAEAGDDGNAQPEEHS